MSRSLTEDERIALNAFVDGELAPAEASAWAGKIAADPVLTQARDEIEAMREAVGRLDRPAVSSAFLQRIQGLASEPAEATPRLTRRWSEGWQNIAAAVVIAALLASSATYYVATPRGTSFEMLAADAHRRSLLAATPVDILSSSRHTVKPWLDAHLGISPPAPDLTAQGYPLLGGRVDVLSQQPVSTLVYRHNEHTISLLARPDSAATTAPAALASGGYNMAEWRGDGFAFTAVSDLEPDELSTFVADYRAATKD